jgi:hypothetical protein
VINDDFLVKIVQFNDDRLTPLNYVNGRDYILVSGVTSNQVTPVFAEIKTVWRNSRLYKFFVLWTSSLKVGRTCVIM